MTALLIVYLIGVSLLALIGASTWLIGLQLDTIERQKGARLLFLAPVWPVLIVPAIRSLWADTGWGR